MDTGKRFVIGTLLCLLNVQSTWAFEGFTEPAEVVDLASAESGILSQVKVQEGDRVGAGDVLAVLDYRLIAASLKVAEARKNSNATIKSTRTELEMQREKLAQFEKLYAAGNARKDEVVRSRLDEKIAAANLERAQEQQLILKLEYQRIQAEIESRFIRSPLDGIVSTVNRDVGETVSTQSPFIRVVNVDQLKFITNAPLEAVSTLNVGEQVRVVLDGNAGEVTGIVEHVAETVDPTSNTVKISVNISDPGRVKSGLAGRLVLD